MITYTLPEHIAKDSKEEMEFWKSEYTPLKQKPAELWTDNDEAYAFYIGYRVAELFLIGIN
jgi:hypothetical protein